jgi:hypothetical protein
MRQQIATLEQSHVIDTLVKHQIRFIHSAPDGAVG